MPLAGGASSRIDDEKAPTSGRAGRAIPSASSSFPTAADRRKSGSMKPDGSEQKAITTIPTEASGVIGLARRQVDRVQQRRLSGVLRTMPATRPEAEAAKNNKVKARVYTSLLYRHWTDWQSSTRKHLLIAPLEGGAGEGSDTRTVRRPARSPSAVPMIMRFRLTARNSRMSRIRNGISRRAPTPTSLSVPIGGRRTEAYHVERRRRRSPIYSPDGKYLAFRSQARAGYESDRWRLVLFERASGRTTIVNEGQDRNVEEITWSPDSTRLFLRR